MEINQTLRSSKLNQLFDGMSEPAWKYNALDKNQSKDYLGYGGLFAAGIKGEQSREK